jgi:hypothetical protein
MDSRPNSSRSSPQSFRVAPYALDTATRVAARAAARAATRDTVIAELREMGSRHSEQQVREAEQEAREAEQEARRLLDLFVTERASRESQREGPWDQARLLLGRLFNPLHGHRRSSIISAWTDISDRDVQDEKRQIRMQIEATR